MQVEIQHSEEYKTFKANISKRQVDIKGNKWIYYDTGPRDLTPVVLVPGTSGTAENYFFQLLSLSGRGYHVVAVKQTNKQR